jgi:hypothetical protein
MKNKALDSNLDFDGMAGTGVNRASRSGVCANPYSIGDKALSQNVGMGPRHGNASSSPRQVGKPATKDALKKTIATAGQGKNDAGGLTMGAAKFSNPDKINVGNK